MRPVTNVANAVFLALFAAACGSSNQPSVTPTQPEPPPAPEPTIVNASLEDVGLSSSALDRSADPCDDFYQFACGGWIAKTEIPADKSRWSRSFSEIFERNEKTLRDILDKAAQNPQADEVSAKIGPFFAACMEEEVIEKEGLAPIKPLLDKAKAIKTPKDVTALVAELHKRQIFPLFDISAEQDFKDATRVIAYLDQNGLGLPDRDYYLRTDDDSKALRKKYEEHVRKMFELAGMKPKQAGEAAIDVLHIETQLAEASKTRVERRDPVGLYNKVDREGLPKLTSELGWDAYFQALGHDDIRDVNVTAPAFFEKVGKLLREVKAPQWRNYFQWQILHATAPLLPKAFVEENFAFEAALTGAKALPERWKRCVAATDRALGEALAQPFVKEAFPGHAKEAAEAMVLEISRVFSGELEKLDWMDADTRKRALEKLSSMAYLIGYPDKWKSYDFPIEGSYAKNVLAARAFDLSRQLAKVGKPVDREEWHMTPPTVNAYYHPLLNHMVFPAGILQPPFYGQGQSLAVNLGGMGMVVGHELTHGFDDQGSQFDAKGNLDNWWTQAVREKFSAKTGCVEEQYASYEAVPGVKLNGKLTLGENIADNAGVMLAFEAFQRMRENAKERVVADGFTEEQQFFLATGQVWCSKEREEWARMAAQVDPHSPPRHRVNGSLANLPAFWEAFQCGEGKAMRRENACKVW